jgi:hypothetical protein
MRGVLFSQADTGAENEGDMNFALRIKKNVVVQP